MTTKKRLWLIFAVIVACMAVKANTASAQHWWVTPNTQPNPADTSLLPKSLTLNWVAPSPWLPVNGETWYAIWARNASGSWYRPNGYTQPSIYRNPVYSWRYTCWLSGSSGFICRDIARQIDRYVACPATITQQPPLLWRSDYNAAWPEYALYTWDRGGVGKRVGCSNLKTLSLQSASVTANGQRINCSYGPTTAQGPGSALDAWCWYY